MSRRRQHGTSADYRKLGRPLFEKFIGRPRPLSVRLRRLWSYDEPHSPPRESDLLIELLGIGKLCHYRPDSRTRIAVERRLREIGWELHRMGEESGPGGGMARMGYAHRMALAVFGGSAARSLEHRWDGVGDWLG